MELEQINESKVKEAFYDMLDTVERKHNKLIPEEKEILVSKRIKEEGIRDSSELYRFLYGV